MKFFFDYYPIFSLYKTNLSSLRICQIPVYGIRKKSIFLEADLDTTIYYHPELLNMIYLILSLKNLETLLFFKPLQTTINWKESMDH